MDTLKAIEKLAQRAREEKMPVFDVADSVWLRIRPQAAPAISFRSFGLFAGVAAVAASIVLFLAVDFWLSMTSPIMEIFAPLQETPLW